MKEDFLYYLWNNKLIDGELFTTSGEPVTVFATGYRNDDSGPDFLEARIKIGDKTWAGHVEIHVKASDWKRHQHHIDKAYNNVILHVVYENDLATAIIPTLELKGHFDETLYEKYQDFITTKGWIPCERSLPDIPKLTLISWLDTVLVERLEQKAEATEKALQDNTFDWEDALYKLIMRYSGLKVNNEAFARLASILPFKTILKHADNLLQVESMLFGCAGFLEKEFTDQYPQLLKREFAVMKAKFNLQTMPIEMWKFLRMRPGNFPTIRLAQLAMMIHNNGCAFSKIMLAKNTEDVKDMLQVEPSEYWLTHYIFDKSSTKRIKRLGNSASEILIINAIVPLLFCYGQLHYDDTLCEKATDYLEQLKAEDNAITRGFSQHGCQPMNAMQSQAMIQLHDHYCKKKRCLECRIGSSLLKE